MHPFARRCQKNYDTAKINPILSTNASSCVREKQLDCKQAFSNQDYFWHILYFSRKKLDQINIEILPTEWHFQPFHSCGLVSKFATSFFSILHTTGTDNLQFSIAAITRTSVGSLVRTLTYHQCRSGFFPRPRWVSYLRWVCFSFSSLLQGFPFGFSHFPTFTETLQSRCTIFS